jgi:hypothetical protein
MDTGVLNLVIILVLGIGQIYKYSGHIKNT